MIKANEAKAMVKNYIEQKEAERLAKIQKFLDNECESVIIATASAGQNECFVEVPTGLHNQIPAINASLTTEGYSCQARYGKHIAILIRW